MRYLAVIQVRPTDGKAPFDEPRALKEGGIRVGDWHIQAGLRADAPASLVIRRADGEATLATGVRELTVAEKACPLAVGEAVLVENRGALVRRSRNGAGDRPQSAP